MRSLRWPIFSLLIYNALFFSIDQAGIWQISPFVHLLGIFSTLVIIFLPIVKKFPVIIHIVFWLGIYILHKYLIYDDSSSLYTLQPATITIEIVMLIIMIVLAANLAKAIYDFEKSYEKFVLLNVGGRVKSVEDAMGEIEQEIFRSRRYERPLSILVIEPDPSSVKSAASHLEVDIKSSMMSRYLYTSLGKILCKLLRRSDLIFEQRDKGQFIILCPETPDSQFNNLVKRIQASVSQQLKISVAFGSASFPETSLTFEELVNKAESQIKHSPNLLKIPSEKYEKAKSF